MPPTLTEDSDHEPFLVQDEVTFIEKGTKFSLLARVQNTRWLILMHFGLSLTYMIIIFTIVITFGRNRGFTPREHMYSVIRGNSIQHEIQTLEPTYAGNPFAGDPRPEHDRAWTEILKNTHIRVSAEELRQMNRTSLALKDGSGYVVQLGAYHELHCVKWIRKWIHREHYWPALKGAMLLERKVHIDHCLEYMRLLAMCRGSHAMTTFDWYGSQPRPMSVDKHECVNWDKFDEWNSDRRVDMYDLDALENRPASEPWELLDHDVRLGIKPGLNEASESQ